MNLSRNELYQLVWNKPIIAIAKEYGFSDVGFAKLCRRHSIPVPPRGYWARVSAGEVIPKPPLPDPDKKGSVYIPQRPTITDDEALQKKTLLAQEKKEIQQLGNIVIPEGIIDPHKLTQNTQKYLEKLIKKIETAKNSKSRPSYFWMVNTLDKGRVVCNEINCFHMRVSESNIDRAIRFLDTLVKELEKNGFTIKTIKNEKSGNSLAAVKDDEYINFQLNEGYKYQQVDKDQSKLTDFERLLYSGKEAVASGKFTFSLLASNNSIGRSWSDGKKLIDTNLATIIHEFISLVPRQKQKRIDDAMRQKLHEEQMKLFREKQHQEYLDKSIYDDAMKEASIFSKLKELDTYLNYLETQYLEKYGSFNEQALSWFATARKVSESQNPVTKRLISLKNS